MKSWDQSADASVAIVNNYILHNRADIGVTSAGLEGRHVVLSQILRADARVKLISKVAIPAFLDSRRKR